MSCDNFLVKSACTTLRSWNTSACALITLRGILRGLVSLRDLVLILIVGVR